MTSLNTKKTKKAEYIMMPVKEKGVFKGKFAKKIIQEKNKSPSDQRSTIYTVYRMNTENQNFFLVHFNYETFEIVFHNPDSNRL